jgi:hypothetical protein
VFSTHFSEKAHPKSFDEGSRYGTRSQPTIPHCSSEYIQSDAMSVAERIEAAKAEVRLSHSSMLTGKPSRRRSRTLPPPPRRRADNSFWHSSGAAARSWPTVPRCSTDFSAPYAPGWRKAHSHVAAAAAAAADDAVSTPLSPRGQWNSPALAGGSFLFPYSKGSIFLIPITNPSLQLSLFNPTPHPPPAPTHQHRRWRSSRMK